MARTPTGENGRGAPAQPNRRISKPPLLVERMAAGFNADPDVELVHPGFGRYNEPQINSPGRL